MATAMESVFAEHHMSIGTAFSGAYGRQFGRTVLAALDNGARHVVVDCSEWRKLDVVLLSALVRCADVFSSRDALFELVNLTPEMRANLRELRLQNRLRVTE